jgi:hypothetical protein
MSTAITSSFCESTRTAQLTDSRELGPSTVRARKRPEPTYELVAVDVGDAVVLEVPLWKSAESTATGFTSEVRRPRSVRRAQIPRGPRT